jgi:hypothetical protein
VNQPAIVYVDGGVSAKTGLASAGTRERGIERPGVPLAAPAAIVAAAGATWYGVLAQTPGHPAVRLAGALALAAGGLAAVLLATPRLPRPPGVVPGGPGMSFAATQAEGVFAVAAILGLLSMAAALIHFAVIEQHWAEYWLYGVFFVVVGLAQLAWAVAIPSTPTRLLLWAGVVGNALVVITWVVTRTAGSLVGPMAATPARVGFGDLVATVMQVLLVAGGAGLLSRRLRPGTGWWAEQAPIVAALIAVPFLVLGLYSAIGGSPFVSMVG